MAGNQGLGDEMIATLGRSVARAPRSPAGEALATRTETLARIASGQIVNDRTEWLDPAICSPWRFHNRELALLDERSCADLIEAFKSEGRQRIPAIVRKSPEFKIAEPTYEIIAGVRRWWTVAWLRAHHYPDFQYLVTVQTLDDEQAFRLSDVENRARADLSDVERGRDYVRALALFYDGRQSEMAKRLNVSDAWLSRLLALGRFPPELISAFHDSRAVKVSHAAELAPFIKRGAAWDRMLAEAGRLAEQQAGARARCEAPLAVPEVLRSLLRAANGTASRPASSRTVSFGSKPMLVVKNGLGGDVILRVKAGSGASVDEVLAEIRTVLVAREGEGV